jgi:ABC-2 type transport system ATP-binding protein
VPSRAGSVAGLENLTTTGTTVILTTHYIDEAEYLANRLILLAAGRIVADTTPEGLRARGGPARIRCPLDDGAPLADLPATLLEHLDRTNHELVIRAENITAPLRDLLDWADRHQMDLEGMEVGPPSLEDAYLAAIREPSTTEGALS